MQVRFDTEAYRHRTQVETVMSMIKRRQGSHVRGKTYWSQARDLRLMALTHNIMILFLLQLFYRAGRSSFLGLGIVSRPKSGHNAPGTFRKARGLAALRVERNPLRVGLCQAADVPRGGYKTFSMI